MLRATRIDPAGHRNPAEAADCVLLDHQARHRRRVTLTGKQGLAFLLDLAGAVRLAEGDAILLEDGRFVLVEAAAERLLEVTAEDAASLTRIAWHLGNRHAPVELRGDRLRILEDHVLAAMVHGLGGSVVPVTAAFSPEGGAYGDAERVHRHE
jgi:urease accessory protein